MREEIERTQDRLRRRWGHEFRFWVDRARELVQFDLPLLTVPLAYVLFGAALMLHVFGQTSRAVALMSTVHRAGYSRRVSSFVEAFLRGKSRETPISAAYRQAALDFSPNSGTVQFFSDPLRIIGSRLLVVKESSPLERGVIIIDYSLTFFLLAKLFDLEAITDRYYLVLEPSWNGYCTPEILVYTQVSTPVFVQCSEPRDAEFIEGLGTNLRAVSTASNWWIDHRVFRPLRGVEKDTDLIMVAGWAGFKRHRALFSALRTNRLRGRRLKTVLVGYAVEFTKQDVLNLAEHCGVEDQVEAYEGMRPPEVNEQYNRAKVNIVWSRKEGCNKAIIEGMLSGVPCILREGFNYGFRYPYINRMTGCYSSESRLPATLLTMVERHREFSPREWVMQNMTPELATEVLTKNIRDVSRSRGEPWSRELAIKTKSLNRMDYMNPPDAQRFNADYQFLRTTLRR
ncbi:MAG: glycosyltransferase [Acidobacteria bacterium]|nr:glycosyltransferase [Acidobacteriota bacterium]